MQHIFLHNLFWITSPPKIFVHRPCLVHLKNQKLFNLSHRILRHMHGALNIDENKNLLHSLLVNRETNLLSLVTL